MVASASYASSFGKAWAPLTSLERAKLVDALKKSKPGTISVSCASADCIDLATGIESAFQDAKWKVTPIHHGGIGIDGVTGIRIDSCGVKAESLRSVIARITDRKIEVIDEGTCHGEDEIFLTIGIQVD